MSNISLNKYYSTDKPWFIYPFTYKRYLGCFQVLVIMNKAAINIRVQVFCVDVSFQLLWVNTKEGKC